MGDAHAQYNLGFMYRKGHGVPKSYKGFTWDQLGRSLGAAWDLQNPVDICKKTVILKLVRGLSASEIFVLVLIKGTTTKE